MGITRYATFVLVMTLIVTLYVNYQRNMDLRVKTLVKNCKLGPSTFNYEGRPLHHPCYRLLSMKSPNAIPFYSQERCPDIDDPKAMRDLADLICTYGVENKQTSVRSALACWHEDDHTIKLPSCLKEVCRILPWKGDKDSSYPEYHVQCGIPYKLKKVTKKELMSGKS